MVLRETTASVMAAVASGLSIEMGGTATNKYEDRMTPVEPRIAGEVAHAVAGMKRSEANEVAKKLLSKYESKLNAPPLGKTLHECWDAEKRRPSKEYARVVVAFKKEMDGLGIKLRPEG
jgi:methylamine--corrinoid protein Co-methyltransferase